MKRCPRNHPRVESDGNGGFGIDPRYPSDSGIDHTLLRRWLGEPTQTHDSMVISDDHEQCFLCLATANPEAEKPGDAIIFDRVSPPFQTVSFLMGWIRNQVRDLAKPKTLAHHIFCRTEVAP